MQSVCPVILPFLFLLSLIKQHRSLSSPYITTPALHRPLLTTVVERQSCCYHEEPRAGGRRRGWGGGGGEAIGAVAADQDAHGGAAAVGSHVRVRLHVGDAVRGEGVHGDRHRPREAPPDQAVHQVQARFHEAGDGGGVVPPHGARPNTHVQRERGTPMAGHSAHHLTTRLSIGAACAMSWPSNKMIVQVLDDSTDPVIKEMVEYECQSWASKGVNVEYEFRNSRSGYKAGALREGLEKSYAKDCDFVAIFDADFQPDPDYLWRTIPFLLTNPELALVQARWKFVNADECLLTRLQEMSLDYHFSVEQEVGSSTYSFFGFNGTAGVWRMQALVDAGGWKDRTTVEDMDLAVRASLRGWKFVFVGDLAVKNELPSTFKAYRFQQHRWSCGPANLFRKMLKEILCCKRVSAWKKFHVIYDFFFVRKIVAHFVTFFFYCVIIPACVLLPDVHLPKFIAVYIPSATTVLNAICTPRSFHLIIFWILFENVMAMHRAKATIIGLLEANRVYEWIVTAKLGNASRNKNSSRSHRRSRCRIVERIHLMEVLMGLFLLYCTIYDIMFGRDLFYVYLFAQSMAFFVVGFGYVGVYVSN